MKKNIIISSVIFFITFSFVSAEISKQNTEILQSFKQIITIDKIDIPVPTVVEVVVPEQVYGSHFGVYNKTDDKFEPYVLTQNSVLGRGFSMTEAESVYTNGSLSKDESIFDNNFQSNVQFDVNEDGVGYTEIQYTFGESVRSNSVNISLDQYVSLPNLVTIKTIENGQEKIIASKIRPDYNVINFPETSSKIWKFEITYSQPLRINELQVNNLNIEKVPTAIRFLAQVDKEYKIYTDPDSIISQKTSERPNLNSNEDLKIIRVSSIGDNPVYKLADTDEDSVPDVHDNCVLIPNTDQEDVNKNNRGDVCDDFDKDGIINSKDNCINEPNSNQIDTDNDQIGDTCDGEESRITEKYPWIVWAGIIFAGLLFLGLFAIAIRKIRFNETEPIDPKQ